MSYAAHWWGALLWKALTSGGLCHYHGGGLYRLLMIRRKKDKMEVELLCMH